ncbi:hypothetical protein ASC89_11340 [Devosia sp. Root413D1]|uniref:FitA-like ribbon-helix-helix domain-containing protein n=1 Tax=unclassified Devosia TaxID=196773 RepID=UPI0006FD643B|nr:MULTISPECIES: hypothetical protein [unclassified Devosia]KQU99344.1 hypothetical protein ASC68_08235 [Devosia sp. Root105]KQW80636.1 hypothetical protein ASC89_11340 [Devosia sp. Root413D1]
MSSLTIRKLDDDLKGRLRRRAAANNRSMEEEARVILRRELDAPGRTEGGLGSEIRKLVEATGGIELDLPPRGPARPLPDIFDE